MQTVPGHSARELHVKSERLGWVVFSALPVITALLLVVHGGRVVRLLYLPMALGIGLYLCFKFPRVYIAYVLMVSSFSALVNRITASQAGLVMGSSILAAPLGVTVLAGLRSWKARLRGTQLLVFALPLLGLLYAACVGIYLHGISPTLIPFVFWLTPILFGLFCFANEDKDRSLGKMFLRSLMVCALLVAIYGCIQYPSPMQWDLDWLSQMQEQGAAGSMGKPESYGVRIFSTLSSPATAAVILVSAILAASQLRSRWRFALIVCYFWTLLLTSVRAAWLSLLLGAVLLMVRATAKGWAQIAAGSLVLAAAIAAGSQTPHGAGIINRFMSISDFKHDTSANDRRQGIQEASKLIKQMPFGGGIGYLSVGRVKFDIVDVGAFAIPVELGYLGTAFYAAGLLLALSSVQFKLLYKNPYVTALSILSLIPLFLLADEDLLNSNNGIYFWAPTAFLMHSVVFPAIQKGRSSRKIADRQTALKQATALARGAL